MTLAQLAENLIGVSLNDVLRVGERVNAMGNCTGNKTVDLSIGNVVTATLTGPGIWTITNPVPLGKTSTVVFILTNPGVNITWASIPKWAGGIAPTLTTTGVDIIVMSTVDGGTTWYARLAPNFA